MTQASVASPPRTQAPLAALERAEGSAAGPSRQQMLEEHRRLQELILQAEELRDPTARALFSECLHSLLAFYGNGLARVLQVVQECGTEAQAAYDRLVNDSIVRGLLLIHGLHPQDLPTRLQQAIERVRPYMESHGGNVELLQLENDVAKLRLQGACKTCPSSAITMELALRHAIEEFCPDLMGMEVEGASQVGTTSTSSPTSRPSTQPLSGDGAHGWTVLENLPELHDSEATALELAGVPLVISRLNGNLYAYRNICPACSIPLETGHLTDNKLHCRKGHNFDIQKAGREAGASGLHLDPFPLLVEAGVVKVAVR